MMNRWEFEKHFPNTFYLDVADPGRLEKYLRANSWIAADEKVEALAKAGDGNMNCTLRINTGKRSLILKQGRPWVEKYPQISAPWGRTDKEGRFYQLISSSPRIRNRMPRKLGIDVHSQILLLEDIGESSDFTNLYSGTKLSWEAFLDLVDYLSELHAFPVPDGDRFSNLEMLRLNYEYIFHLPLLPGGAANLESITSGLETVADGLRTDLKYCKEVRRLGELYLAEGKTLLHGDYYPGSWLNTSAGIRVIDPEFCFFGPAEFDVGVFLAHLRLCDLSSPFENAFFEWYGASEGFDVRLAFKFAGVEIMRRLIGIAQLPLKPDLARKTDLLLLSKDWVLSDS